MSTEVQEQSSNDLITIAHVVFRFDYGGMENGIVNVINNTDPTRFRHVVIALSEVTDFSKRVTAANVRFVALNKKPGKDFPMYKRLFDALREIEPDIYHSRNIGTIDTVPIARLAGIKTCIHGEHGWDIHDPDGKNKKYQWMRRLMSPFITGFMTVSRQLFEWLTGTVSIPAAKVTHICNGVDTERFSPAVDDASKRRLLPADIFPDDAIVMGSIGRLEPIKDPLNLVDAFISLAARDDGRAQRLRLLYVGDGSLRASVIQRLEEAGVMDRVWLPGSRDDTPELLQCMDFFVLPSLREGISNTILEAMASGLPVIATDTGGNGELVKHGATGALIPVADADALATAAQRYLDEPTVRETHALAARDDAVERLSLQTMVGHYETLYAALAKR
ncbi:MAG: TIGR03088 family PEP-CTERM/XrtA system glycosyltransferase [Woeseiaceae bacterium]